MGKAKSSFQEKVDWMVNHFDLWRGWPEHPLHTDDQIKRKMVADGLISANSNSYDIMDFGKLVMAARSQMRKMSTHEIISHFTGRGI